MKFALILAAVVVVLATATVCFAAPTKPQWANQFDAPFGLNIDFLFTHVHNRSSHFYYNWDLKTQRVSYPLGCLPIITKKPCDIVFNDAGAYLLAPEDNKPCCMLFKGVGAVPPNFLKPFTYSGHAGVTDMYGKSHGANHWKGPEFFGYWTDSKTGDDVQFKDGPTGTYWNYGRLNFAKQPASLFKLPATCTSSCHVLNKMTLKDIHPLHQFFEKN